MYKGIVISQDGAVRQECTEVVSENGNISVTYLDRIDELTEIANDYTFLFILINDFKAISVNKIKEMNDTFPATAIILYNHSLFLGQLESLEDITDTHVVIGDERKFNLDKTLKHIINSHWRRLPLKEFNITESRLSPRIREAIAYVERNKLDVCTLPIIAQHVGLSAGYFSQEFKRETGYTFRGFIQRVLVYYEERVFVNLNLSAFKMAKLLGYSELSSFSRSFKKRRGISPAQFIKKSKLVKN